VNIPCDTCKRFTKEITHEEKNCFDMFCPAKYNTPEIIVEKYLQKKEIDLNKIELIINGEKYEFYKKDI
jgi:hypothetical protein